MDWSEWANLAVRWIHVFAGILWIGQTWLFMWLDGRFEAPEENPGGRVFMVHSGGFYVVEKRKSLDAMPPTLHWFKWEAALTWLSGFLLLLIVYYAGGLLVAADSSVSERVAMAAGLALLPAAWLVYDTLWRFARGAAGAAASFLLIVAVAWGLAHVLSDRAAYIHVGAMLGTLMAANVWLRILPAQREMIAAIRAGRAPDASLGQRAKERSKHNTFMVVPLVLVMLSNHFPTATYGSRYAWAVLGALTLVGWGAVLVLRKR